jgi:cell division protein FtsA
MPRNKSKQILALDIGTRTIMGVVMELTDRGFRLRAAELYEHKQRAMFDGQVHNIAAVADGVLRVKTALERRCKRKFQQAAVAAAGRSLKMAIGQVQHTRSNLSAVVYEEIRALELEALRSAQATLAQREGESMAAGLFCVCYSCSQYLLEGEPISELEGQFGREIGVELVATFLPRVVVTSLFAVLEQAGLEPASLTLEPIAALQLCVPASMRQLNLALVDIGAGTADIALVRKGHVFAYAMAPVAGDEITDALCEQYLLDFDTGETIKRQLNYTDTVNFTDILGQEHQLASADIIAALQPSIQQVATRIAAEILPLNGGPPNAVLLVGGGSLTPGLPQAIARALELPESRVGIRTRETIRNVTGQSRKLFGPQGITPIGIAAAAFGDGPLQFVDVSVNGQPIPLWQGSGQTVADALLATGGSWTRLFGRPGLALTVEVNGELKVIPGKRGQPPVILINKQPADLDTPLNPGDKVEFTPGADGQPAQAKIRDLIPDNKHIYVNQQKIPFAPSILINNKPANLDTNVPDRAKITLSWQRPVKEILEIAGVPPTALWQQEISYLLGGQSFCLSYSPCQVRLDNHPCCLLDPVRPGARLNYCLDTSPPTVASALQGHVTLQAPVTVTVNGEQISLPESNTKVLVNGRPAKLQDRLVPESEITLIPGRNEFIVSDLFTLIDIKQSVRPGTTLQITVNGNKANFATPLQSGDQVALNWEPIVNGSKGGDDNGCSQDTSGS